MPLKNEKLDWLSATQFVLSLLAAFAFLGISLLLVCLSLGQVIQQPNELQVPLSFLLIAAGMFLSGCLLLPSAWLALTRLIGWKSADFRFIKGKLQPIYIVSAFLIVLLLGYYASRQPTPAILVLPFLQILAIGLPVLLFVQLATRGLSMDSDQTSWGVFGAGLALSPLVILIAEVAALLGVLFFFTINPQLVNLLTSLVGLIRSSFKDPQAILSAMQPFFSKPLVIFSILSYGALLVPLIEELFKPIGVWFLASESFTPRRGFVAGVLCGAGYALFESLAITSNGEDWAMIILARLGTAIIHITTTALSGWALASAWQKNQYYRLGLIYLCTVAIHGLWNGLTLCAVLTALTQTQYLSPTNQLVIRIGQGAPLGLMVLLAGSFILLLLSNKKLRSFPEDEPVASEIPT